MNNMIYLDYAALTPVEDEMLDIYVKVTKEFIANANSSHALGIKSKRLLNNTYHKLSTILNCYDKELIFTSGASESNSMSIKGVVETNGYRGKHIITSRLEHKGILDLMNHLSTTGYTIDYVNILDNGQIDLNDLENKIKDDTILISICAVNSEVGYIQDLHKIREIINRKNPRTVFHSDITQALSKINIDLSILDLASFSSNKFPCPKGCGILYKKSSLVIDELIYGSTANTPFRGGTPTLPLIVSFAYSISKELENIEENNKKCKYLNKMIIDKLSNYDIKINSNELCIPQIINISLLNIDNKEFIKELSNNNIYLSTTSACLHESIILKEINTDDRVSKTSLRISISHKTTTEEIETFLTVFDTIYNKLKG